MSLKFLFSDGFTGYRPCLNGQGPDQGHAFAHRQVSEVVLEALLRECGLFDYPMAAIGHTCIVAFFGVGVLFCLSPAYTNSPIDRIPIGSRLVNGSPYRTPIVFPQ